MTPSRPDALVQRHIQYLLNATYGDDGTFAAVRLLLPLLTDAQRVEAFAPYCRHCGMPETPCPCANDE